MAKQNVLVGETITEVMLAEDKKAILVQTTQDDESVGILIASRIREDS